MWAAMGKLESLGTDLHVRTVCLFLYLLDMYVCACMSMCIICTA